MQMQGGKERTGSKQEHCGGWERFILLTFPHRFQCVTAVKEIIISAFERLQNALLAYRRCGPKQPLPSSYCGVLMFIHSLYLSKASEY